MEEEVKLTLRLPKGLHDDLARIAVAEVRSLNGQIVFLLAKSIEREGAPKRSSSKTGEEIT